MLKFFIIFVLCQTGLLSVSCNDQHDTGFLVQCDSSCTLPGFPANGRFTVLGAPADTLSGAVVPNSTVIQYNCDVSYVSRFPANGRFTVLGAPADTLPGAVVPISTVIQYNCDVSYEPYPHSTAVCIDGIWNTQFTKCEKKVTCPLPTKPAHGSYELLGLFHPLIQGTEVSHYSVLIYSCDANFEIVGNRTALCIHGLWTAEPPQCQKTPSDCGDVVGDTSGVFVIHPDITTEPFEVYCDLTLEGQKWTVIQQRLSKEENFYRDYKDYSGGFGSKTGNHWLGLEHIHEITKEGHHELYVELEAHNGTKAFARYDIFMVGNSSTGFQLTINGYSGTAGDSMYDTEHSHNNNNGMKFTTFDKDQDNFEGNRAVYHYGGWWYNWGSVSNLNGRYHDTAVDNWETLYWYYNFKTYALKSARMLIRRK